VKVRVRIKNTAIAGYSIKDVLYCWKHYLELENNMRSVDYASVVKSSMFPGGT
jgi:hypothetical protein